MSWLAHIYRHGSRSPVEDKGTLHTGGVERWAGCGGCRDGDTAREDLEYPGVPFGSGNEGVAALDMLAWPDGQYCAALKRGQSG
jgi:hypothetical protein